MVRKFFVNFLAGFKNCMAFAKFSHLVAINYVPIKIILVIEIYVSTQKYTRHTHSVNASCSYEVHEDICIHTNGSLEDVALL